MKIIFIIIASFSLGLGILGIFLPLLPTTPFLLLSAALYAKSSDKLYHRLLNHRILGEYIKNFREEKAIPLHTKIFAIVMLWLTMGYTIFFVVNENRYLQVILALTAIAVSVHIFSYKTKKKNTN
ncbi:conserved membrane hypothetical protein [uncultured Paludibacter sp.]|nr:conserved membrane hypothetical protein [uncultured Paludibacter sp.]